MDRVGKKYRKRQRSKYAELERTPLDVEIARYLRFKVPRKSTTMQKQGVEYFVGSKAVDVLMESKWAERKKGTKQTFVIREDATKYLNQLLRKKFFYRVMKNEKEPKKKESQEDGKEKVDKPKPELVEDKNTEVPETKLRKRKVKKVGDDASEDKSEDSKSNTAKDKTKSKMKEKKPKEKAKKRYKLTEHDDQVFIDSKEIYIWLYNPVSWKTIMMGMGVLLIVVAGTLFPLWPPEVRVGVYYLSVAGGAFIGSIFAIALARTVLYGLIWLFTAGNHHLWILPNILADVGFFDSFKPWYSYEYKGSTENEDDGQDEEEEEEEQDSDEGGNDDDAEEGEQGNGGGEMNEENADKVSHHSQSERSDASGSESVSH